MSALKHFKEEARSPTADYGFPSPILPQAEREQRKFRVKTAAKIEQTVICAMDGSRYTEAAPKIGQRLTLIS